MSRTLSLMLVDIPQRPLSLEQYFALYPPDGTLVELVDGVAVTMNSPTGPHQRLISRLAQLLAPACPAGFEAVVGPIDWVLWKLPRPTVRIPDLVVVRQDEAGAERLTEAPLLAVEVLSPYSYERDVVAKRQEYARAGLRHYWIANPETGSIVRYGRQGDELVEVGRLIAGHPATVTEPFAITFDTAALVGLRRG